MRRRWERCAAVVIALVMICSIYLLVHLMIHPNLPRLLSFVIYLMLGGMLVNGYLQMKGKRKRPKYWMDLQEAIPGKTLSQFEVCYPDFYYLDLKLDSDVPVTVAVVKEGEETVYQAQGEHWSEENVRLAIRKPGYYKLMVTAEETYETDAEIKLTYKIY